MVTRSGVRTWIARGETALRAPTVAAAVLAIESLMFIWVHAKYGEITPIIMSGLLGLLMAFIAYGRMVLKPIF